jgi:steroid 17alpha-monooxygenase/17alpha-hydroxyprogesterone aldolase/cytochrome P450 family 1 subfamily A polypeptide 1
MSLLDVIIQSPAQILTGLLIGAVTVFSYFVLKLYYCRRNYPPGPTPLPLVGNLRQLAKPTHIHHTFYEIGEKYNGVFTFHVGHEPQVVVTDPHLALEVLKKHQFAGRPKLPMNEIFFKEGSTDVIFSDFNKEWEVLRKVSHAAIRKYAVSDKLTYVVADTVDEVVKRIKETEGINKPIDMRNYLFLIMYSVLAHSAFGKKYTLDHPELLAWIDSTEQTLKYNSEFLLISFLPSLKHIFRKAWKAIHDAIKFQNDYHEKDYNEHVKSFDPEEMRDFTDALLLARKEAEEEEGSSILKYLKPLNIQNSVNDLFGAGSETSRQTLTWAFLFMANYEEMQNRVREEIQTHIPDNEVPNLNHRNKCNYLTAFIAEVLRFRYIVPQGIPHKATVDMELGGHRIKKDTPIIVSMVRGMHDKETWGDPENFRPERFLDSNGNFIARPNAFYIPFSSGRRSCPGEKMALADIFFIIARFFQQTKGYCFVLPEGPGSVDLNGNLQEAFGWTANDYKIILKEL